MAGCVISHKRLKRSIAKARGMYIAGVLLKKPLAVADGRNQRGRELYFFTRKSDTSIIVLKSDWRVNRN